MNALNLVIQITGQAGRGLYSSIEVHIEDGGTVVQHTADCWVTPLAEVAQCGTGRGAPDTYVVFMMRDSYFLVVKYNKLSI